MTRPSGPTIARSQRRRRKVEISISDEARAALDALAEREHGGNRSAAVEALAVASLRRRRAR